MTATPPPPPRDTLRAYLISLMAKVLTFIRGPVGAPVEVTADDGTYRLAAILSRSSDLPPKKVGRWLSDREQRAVDVLVAAGEALSRAELCRRLGWNYDPTAKALLTNLLERDILAEDDAGRLLLAT